MCRWLIAVLTLCALVSPAHAEQVALKTITVFGQASTFIEPDRSVWRLTAAARDPKLDVATAAVQSITEQALALGQSLGLGPKEMQIGRVSVDMNYESKDGRTTQKFSHYYVKQALTFYQLDLVRYDEFRDALTGVPGLQTSQNFQAANVDSTRDAMRLAALRSARIKAEALAAVVGLKVGSALSVSEFRPCGTHNDYDPVSLQRGVILDLGRPEGIEISATVYATFEMQ